MRIPDSASIKEYIVALTPQPLFKSNFYTTCIIYVYACSHVHACITVCVHPFVFCPYLSLHPYHPSVSPIFGYPTYEVSASYIRSSNDLLNLRCQPNGGNEEFRQGNLSDITSFEIESGPHGNIQLLPQNIGPCVYNVTVSWHLVSAVRASACATAHSHSDTLFGDDCKLIDTCTYISTCACTGVCTHTHTHTPACVHTHTPAQLQTTHPYSYPFTFYYTPLPAAG